MHKRNISEDLPPPPEMNTWKWYTWCQHKTVSQLASCVRAAATCSRANAASPEPACQVNLCSSAFMTGWWVVLGVVWLQQPRVETHLTIVACERLANIATKAKPCLLLDDKPAIMRSPSASASRELHCCWTSMHAQRTATCLLLIPSWPYACAENCHMPAADTYAQYACAERRRHLE
jgi:hypothetical protein